MRVFIAHNKESEGDLAAEIATKLRARGFDVFFDEDSLPPGQDFDSRIERAITVSSIFVFLISHASVKASYARTELAIAKRRWPNPSGRVLPVLLEDVESKSIDPYLRAITYLRPSGDRAADTTLAVKQLRRALRLRRATIGAIAASALAALAVTGTMMWPVDTPPPQEATVLRVARVERHHEGKPGEGDVFLVNLVARNGQSTPITFEQLTIESRLSDMTAEVSHEGDRQYWLVVEGGATKQWPMFVTWKRGTSAMRAGDFQDRFDWRVCWVVAKLRDCGSWQPWEPAGAFAASSVRRVEDKLALRARVVNAVPAPRGADETGFWIGLAEPNELARITYNGDIAKTIALPGEPVRITRALDGPFAFVATRKPNLIVTIDLAQGTVVRTDAVPSEKGRADLPFSLAWDGKRLWVLFDDANGGEALRVLEQARWAKLPYDATLVKLGNTLDELRLHARNGVVLGLTSSSPRYIYRFAPDRAWEVSGHDVSFIGCMSTLTATSDRWLGVACGFSLSEVVEQQWPDGKELPIEANKAVDELVIQKGLDADYAPFDWDARALAAAGETAVIALARYARQTNKLEESAVVYRDTTAVWRELFRNSIDVVELAVSNDHALVFAQDKGKPQLFLVQLH